MQNAPLIGIHRLKGVALTGAQHIGRVFLGQVLQGFLTLFPVVAHIQGHAHILIGLLFDLQRGQVLQGVQGLAPVADDNTVILAVNGDLHQAVLQNAGHLGILHLQALDQAL